jgi:hypothetical protein
LPGPNGKRTLHDGFATHLFVELQITEKRGIDPLKWFCGENESWQSCKGRSMKILLFAYHQIIAEEDKRISEIKPITK